MLNEIWKEIKDFPDYEISNLGQVRSYWRQGGGKSKLMPTPQRILRGGYDNYGYHVVGISKDGRRYSQTIHRLVAEAFLEPCPIGKEVLHGPNGKLDNRPSNLSWGTKKQNCADRQRDGTENFVYGELHGQHILTENDVRWIRNNYIPIPRGHGRCKCHANYLTQKQIGIKFGVSHRTVSDIINNITWTTILG